MWMGKGNHFGKEQGFGLLKLFLPLEVATNQTSTDRVYKQTGFRALFVFSPPPQYAKRTAVKLNNYVFAVA